MANFGRLLEADHATCLGHETCAAWLVSLPLSSTVVYASVTVLRGGTLPCVPHCFWINRRENERWGALGSLCFSSMVCRTCYRRRFLDEIRKEEQGGRTSVDQGTPR